MNTTHSFRKRNCHRQIADFDTVLSLYIRRSTQSVGKSERWQTAWNKIAFSIKNLTSGILTIKLTNALYFLVMFINPTHVSAAIEPSSVVQGHVHFNIHCSIWYHHLYTTMYVSFLLTVDNTHCCRLYNLIF
jgi:hypothetical protein